VLKKRKGGGGPALSPFFGQEAGPIGTAAGGKRSAGLNFPPRLSRRHMAGGKGRGKRTQAVQLKFLYLLEKKKKSAERGGRGKEEDNEPID